MEEDIKVINRIIEFYKDLDEMHSKGKCSEISALENLLQAYKEDEAVIDKMAGYIDLAADEHISKMLNKGDVAYYGSRYCIKRFFRNKVKEVVR